MEVVGPTSSVNPPKQPLHVSDGLEQGRLEGGGGDEFDDKEISTKKTSASVLTSLFWTWANECAWPGMGLFGESYLLFSVGTLVPIWSRLYPPCQEDNDDDDDNEVDCVNRHLFESTTYTVVIGVILGMIVLGHLSNRIGRRKGSIATASFMAASAVGLTLATLIVEDANALFITMNALLFLFGFGVGGEYPLSASSASEKAMGIYHHRLEQELQQQRHRKQSSNSALAELANKANVTDPTPPPQANHLRGQKVQLVFMMQGLGILVNSITLSCLLMAFGQWTEKDYKASSLLWIWRITYGIGALVLMYVLVSRILYLEESKAWLEDKEQREQQKQQQLQDEASNQSPKGTAALREPIPMVAITSSVSELSAPSVVFNHTDEYDLWKDGTRPGGSNLFRGDDSTTTKQSRELPHTHTHINYKHIFSLTHTHVSLSLSLSPFAHSVSVAAPAVWDAVVWFVHGMVVVGCGVLRQQVVSEHLFGGADWSGLDAAGNEFGGHAQRRCGPTRIRGGRSVHR